MKHFYQKSLQIVAACSAVLIIGVGVARADSGEVLANLVVPQSPEDTSSIDQRLAIRKDTYKAMLPATANAAIASKCVLAQSTIAEIKTKDVKAASVRFDAYNSLATRLSYLVDNLSGQSVDASTLLDAQNKFVNAVNTYLVDASAYKAAIDDSVTIDCQKDPAGFRASLLDTRALRTKLSGDVAAVKASTATVRKALSTERQILIKNPGHAPTGKVGTKAS
jgi:microcompartment protein CcmL/EutN